MKIKIIHAKEHEAKGGNITCTEFVDANGKKYNNWIPARLRGNKNNI